MSLDQTRTVSGTPSLSTSQNADVLTGGDDFGCIVGGTVNETVGFYGAHGVSQQTAGDVTTGFTANTGTAVLSGSTFTGDVGSTAYTIGDIVATLKNLNIIVS